MTITFFHTTSRQNIFLEVMVPNCFEDAFADYLKELREKKGKAPKAIIYARYVKSFIRVQCQFFKIFFLLIILGLVFIEKLKQSLTYLPG